MSEFKGTKGKWNQNRLCVFVGDEEIVHENIVCRLHRGVFDYMEKEQEANALLISKAPEMLEMLQYISNKLNGNGFPTLQFEIDQLIKEATDVECESIKALNTV